MIGDPHHNNTISHECGNSAPFTKCHTAAIKGKLPTAALRGQALTTETEIGLKILLPVFGTTTT
jgi:hypothetical protein